MEFKIENTQVFGLERSAIASGNPMRTEIDCLDEEGQCKKKDFKRLEKLGTTGVGEGHDQALTGCIVQFDLYAPLYMWKQIQRYHFIDYISSQSTMHRLLSFDVKSQCTSDTDPVILERYQQLIDEYWKFATELESGLVPQSVEYMKQMEQEKKKKWRTLVASLPSGFVLGATMTTNYRQLKTIYYQRKNHKLNEWKEFCKWIEKLPHSDLFIDTIVLDNK
jgi:hypothetical protein